MSEAPNAGIPLIIVGCGKAKIWDRNPSLGAVCARDVYTSWLFKLCSRYAEARADDHWVILSAKYGFLAPANLITNYDVAFGTDPCAITIPELREQWRQRFSRVTRICSLAGKAYQDRILGAVPDGVAIEEPLNGLNPFERTAWLAKSKCNSRRAETRISQNIDGR